MPLLLLSFLLNNPKPILLLTGKNTVLRKLKRRKKSLLKVQVKPVLTLWSKITKWPE
jgi:hypothetical protein